MSQNNTMNEIKPFDYAEKLKECSIMEAELNDIMDQVRNHTKSNIDVQLRIANINTTTIASGYKLLDVVGKLDEEYGHVNDLQKQILKTMHSYEGEMKKVQENLLKRMEKPMAVLEGETEES
ncbi:DgyrCDS1197 [Dimorphilus gyrociliatus]|uniref:DgyrCDS1197 n=1 Tax=Dimorphilus gyrociliatus TaxID=2664684 RepID=A0A7I8V6P5_9ANNE|nr:DgyrCDS1197 [Dimorphilus gyrociliatus]